MSILVTLCIPTFNRCHFLGRAIRSAINQTFAKDKYEIIVIDDEEAALMEFHFKDVFEKFNYTFHFSEQEQASAAREHYKWLNHFSKFKADFSLATR